MTIHSHNFVETYKGLVGFGADRNTDENTVIYYLQKFSDDRLMNRFFAKTRNYHALIADLDGLFATFFTDSTKSSSGNGLGKTTSKPES